jgi:hypothetical protein
MKIKMRPDEAGTSGTGEWAKMSGWLAELREDGQAEPDSDGSAGTDSRGHDEAGSQSHTGMAIRSHTGTDNRPHTGTDNRAHTGTDNRAWTGTDNRAWTGTDSRAHTGTDSRGHVQPASAVGWRAMTSAAAPPNTYESRPRAGARARVSARAESSPVGALIGDELRMPIAWCEMGSCISWHADRSALGEADNRARAISGGWRIDALGRLTCPRCQQTSTSFRATRPVVPWDRATAITMAARAAAGPGYRNTGSVPRASGRRTRRPASGYR